MAVRQLTYHREGQRYSLQVGEAPKERSRRLRRPLNPLPDGLTIYRNMAVVYEGLCESELAAKYRTLAEELDNLQVGTHMDS